MPRMAIRRYPWSPIFLRSFADSTDEVVKQHGGHMVPGWEHAVVSQSHIDREKCKVFMWLEGRAGDVSLQLFV